MNFMDGLNRRDIVGRTTDKPRTVTTYNSHRGGYPYKVIVTRGMKLPTLSLEEIEFKDLLAYEECRTEEQAFDSHLKHMKSFPY